MSEPGRGAVVVGVDGSVGSISALQFALDEGLRRGVAVHVVTGWLWNSPYSRTDGPTTLEKARLAAVAMQDRVVGQVLAERQEQPEVVSTVVHGFGAKVLLDASRQEAVLVIGHSPRSGVGRAALGTVSEQCLRHAEAPVILVPTSALRRAVPRQTRRSGTPSRSATGP